MGSFCQKAYQGYYIYCTLPNNVCQLRSCTIYNVLCTLPAQCTLTVLLLELYCVHSVQCTLTVLLLELYYALYLHSVSCTLTVLLLELYCVLYLHSVQCTLTILLFELYCTLPAQCLVNAGSVLQVSCTLLSNDGTGTRATFKTKKQT